MKFYSLFKNSSLNFFIKIYGAIISILVVIIAARYLSTYDFGTFAFYISLSGFFAYLSAFGQEQLIIKKSSYFKKTIRAPALLGSTFSVVIIASVIFSLFFLILWSSDISGYGNAYLLCAFSVPILAVRRLQTSVLRNWGFSKHCILAESVFYPTLLAFFSFLYFYISDSISLEIYFFIVYLCLFASILLNFYLASNLKVVIFKPPVFTNLNANFYTAMPFLLFALTEALAIFADKILLAYLTTPEQLAIYHVALRIAALALFFESAILLSTLSVISKNFSKKDFAVLQALIYKQSYLNFAFFISFAVFCFLFADDILNLFGEEYILGADILILSSFGLAINSIFGSPSYIMTVTGMEKDAYKINLFFLILYLLLIPVVLSIFGLFFVVLLKVLMDIARIMLCWYMLNFKNKINTSIIFR